MAPWLGFTNLPSGDTAGHPFSLINIDVQRALIAFRIGSAASDDDEPLSGNAPGLTVVLVNAEIAKHADRRRLFTRCSPKIGVFK